MKWYLKDLRDDVLCLYGEEQLVKLNSSLESIFENHDFSRYHYAEIQRLIESHMEGKDPCSDYVRLVLDTDSGTRNSEYEFSLAYRANVLALLKNLHSVNDFLAHTVYFSLGLNLGAKCVIAPRALTLYQVKKKLKLVDGTEQLLSLLNDLTEYPDNIYLKDFVNYTKHRANIMSRITYDSNKFGKDIYQIFIVDFDGDDGKHESRLVDNFLNSEYERQNELVMRIGNEINEIVKSVLTRQSR